MSDDATDVVASIFAGRLLLVDEPEQIRRVAYDGLEDVADFEVRRGRCYELAGHAVMFGLAPRGSLLVHGSWHGRYGARRIGHAWVVLPRRNEVWEPIRGYVYDLDAFAEWSRIRPERVYEKERAVLESVRSGHYGRWHESEWP